MEVVASGRLLTLSVFYGSSAQTTGYYTEPNTNLTFYLYSASTSDTTGGYSFGYVAPETNPDYEYVGIMVSINQNLSLKVADQVQDRSLAKWHWLEWYEPCWTHDKLLALDGLAI